MRSAAGAMLLCACGCALSHGTGAPDAGVDADCPAPTLVAVPTAPSGCALDLHIGTCELPPVIWRPCTDGVPASACEVAPLAGYHPAGNALATQTEDGDALFAVAGWGASTVVVSSRGAPSLLVRALERTPDAGVHCASSVDALSRTAWALTLESVLPGGARTFDTPLGPRAGVASWAAPPPGPRASLGARGATDGTVAVLPEGDHVALAAADGVTVVAATRGTARRAVAAVDGRALWIETRGDGTDVVVQRRTDGTVESYYDPGAALVAFATDGPAFVWVEARDGILTAFTAPIVATPGDLLPRQVLDDPGARTWSRARGTPDLAAFGHARIVLGEYADTDHEQLVVVEDATGRATSFALPPMHDVYAAAFETPTELVVLENGPGPTDTQLRRIHLAALPSLGP